MNKAIVGVLYVVATPIGNLQDLSFRALESLKNSQLIVAEDTRHCKVLLSHYGVQTPVRSLHEHNEKEEAQAVVKLLREGQSVALISDAGTPLISDPGYRLVQEARKAGIQVSPIPGACAAIAALSAAGLATDRFIFEGFLPVKTEARKKRLEKLAVEERTLIFYEAPHRIIEMLTDLRDVFGPERQAVLAREITKLFETIHGAPLGGLVEWVQADKNQQKGEMVVVVEGAPETTEKKLDLPVGKVLDILLKDLPVNQAVKLACELTGEKRNKLYKEAIERSS